MYVIKGIKQCSYYELDDKEEVLLVQVDHSKGKKEDFLFKREKVDFFIHPRAISG